MKTILHSLHIGASTDTVFDALTTEDGLAGWWTTSVEADEEVGGTIRFTFRGDFNPVMEITAMEPGREVRWRCADGHEPWQDNTFRFALEARDEGTRLHFTQEYARELSDEAYGTYNFNWGYYLNSLKQLCETGTGAPYAP